MTDEQKLKRLKHKPTLDDIVKPKTNDDTDLVFRVAMTRAKKDQDKLLKKAAAL